VVLEFPPLAVTETVEIIYTAQPLVDVPGFTYASHLFTLEAYNQAGQPVTQFAQPVQITIKDIDPLHIPGISLYYQDSQTDKWEIIPSSVINNNVVAYLNHLTPFALLSDTTAPATSINLSGTLGSKGYYTSYVTVTLDAADQGSGVDKTEYSLDGGGSWNLYTAPFIVSAEGTTTIQAKSTDKVGNIEDPPVTQVVNIDKTQPSITNQSPTEPVQTYRPLISATLLDETSGIDSSSITMKVDGTTVNASFNPLTGEISYTPSADLAKGKHTVALTAKDLAGNSTTSSWSFVVFGTPVSGTISTNTTWTKDRSPYIITGITISSGTTLTIEPGTIVKFDSSGLIVRGTLLANGTSQDKIIFTSIKDDSYGGDTNNDGSATSPAPGNWTAIDFVSSSASSVGNSIIKYGGATHVIWDGNHVEENLIGALSFYNSSPTISNNTVLNSVAGMDMRFSSPTITGNIIKDNQQKGMYFYKTSSPTIQGNTIKNNDGYGIYFSYRLGVPCLNHNDILDHTIKALYEYAPFSADPINAEYNWWDSTEKPTNKISGNVDYDPWTLSPHAHGKGGADAEGRYGSNTPCGYFGEPVNTAIGNYTYEHEDIKIPGKGLPLQITRSYNSLDTVYNGPIGYGWTFNYNISLRPNADESVTLMLEDGKRNTYTKNSDGSYTPPEGVQDTLIKNPDGTYTLTLKNQTKYDFASSGRLISQVDKNGNTTSFAYDADGKLTTATDPGSRTLTFTYTGDRITKIQDQTGRNVQYGYDASGDLTSVTDLSGYVTTFTYNSEHQLLTMKEPEPSVNPFLTNHYLDGKVDYQYDAFMSQNLWSYDTVNHKTTCTDNKGGQTVHEYDASNRLTKSTDPLNHSTISSYSTYDQPDYVTNQNGKTTYFGYDANGNTRSTRDPLNHTITASYDLSNNNLLWTRDALLRQTTYSYDPLGINLLSITSPIGTTAFTYYPDGLLNTTTDANSHTTSFGYNSYGNLTSITDPLYKVTSFEYDSVGRMSASIDGDNHKTQFVYDNLGNIKTIKDPLAISDPTGRHQVDFTYDGNGNQKTFRDANNNLTQFDYDPMDNLTSVTDANNKTTDYGYDQNYNLHTVTDPLLHTTTYDYYGNNKLWKITDPLTNVLEFNYDPAGNLTKTIYPNGNETNCSYYDDNLLHTVTYNNEPTAYTYTYYNPTHTIDSVTDNNGKVNSYQYDDGDRLTEATDHTNPAHLSGFTVNRGYDGVSNLTSLAYAGAAYTYGYNARDDLTSLLLPTGSVSFSYDDARNRTDVTTPDNTNQHYTYNEANRITGVTNTTASGTQNFTYTHDSNGNILTENSTSYGYDALNRLASWSEGGTTTTYEYDDAGNLLTVKENGVPTKTFTYDAANQISNTGFSYDANGNMMSDGNFNYVYDGENRLKKVTKVSDGSTVAEYTYDYLGRRTSKTLSGQTTYFHYDGWNVVAETDSTGATTATYTYDNRNQLVSMTRAGQTYYYQYNAHRDVVSLTDSSGNIVNTHEYDPWGKVLTSSETVENPYRYAGYRYDSETELYYLQHRYYDPQIMRFLTKDARAGYQNDPQSFNSYVYCFDNPTTNIDNTGLWGRIIHQGMTYKWARDIGFSHEEAKTIAYSDWQTDIKEPYERGRHLNTNLSWFVLQELARTSQSQYARECKSQAIKYMDLEILGRGLHSIQDEICHGKLYFFGKHIGEIFGYDPDKDFGWGRWEETEAATKAYLTEYRVKTSQKTWDTLF
jgi:RHS repeat-associated protein